jgi:drug/metabolite transporter (DMT)-like permease
MPISMMALVLLSACLHASWNAAVKGTGDYQRMTLLVGISSGLLGAWALFLLAPPARASWPCLAVSSVCSAVYFVLLAHTYRFAALGRAYPIMRGTTPLLVALGSVILVGERLSGPAWLAVGLICAGILGLAAAPGQGQGKGVLLALACAALAATCTLVDGLGVRRSGSPAAYTLWLYLLTSLPLLAWAWPRRALFRDCPPGHLALGLAGGAASVLSYGLVLWVMLRVPVAMAAALRETSILFAAALSALVLKERLGRRRLAMAGLIAAGAVVLRLA